MHITTLLTTVSLALLTTANPSRIDPNAMATNILTNGATCANKDGGNLNALITHFCRKTPNGVTIGTDWTRGGVIHDNMKVSISGESCPSNAVWVPEKYCEGQFLWMCANGGPKGGKVSTFGPGGCQTWKIENLAKEAVAGLAADLHH